jgi:hypothetical protein
VKCEAGTCFLFKLSKSSVPFSEGTHHHLDEFGVFKLTFLPYDFYLILSHSTVTSYRVRRAQKSFSIQFSEMNNWGRISMTNPGKYPVWMFKR